GRLDGRSSSIGRLNAGFSVALLLWPALLAVAVLLGLPLVVLLGRALLGGALVGYLDNRVVLSALTLSLTSSALALLGCLLLGTPAAYLLSRRRFPGRRLLDTLVDLPIVLPP